MILDKISNRVYANCEGETGGNVGIVIMDDTVAAVDAQYPVSGADFRRSIRGVTEKPVTHLLLTHVHGDHVLGNQAFEDCEIVSHHRLKGKMEESLSNEWAPENLEETLKEIKKNRPERAYLYEGLKIVLPTTTFEERYDLDDIEVLHLPGHTDCSSIVHVPQDKVLFAGDLMFAQTFPWAGDPTANPDEWIQAYKTLLDMDIETFIPGHGPPCGKEEFEKQLDWFETAKDKMRALIDSGATEEQAIEVSHYPKLYEDTGDRFERSMRHWYKFYSEKKEKI
ncbi:MAG: MBL fold metallo-hydrolase [Candidatus Bathyarchaeota archaeon]|jgi:glyoxylase-like metal-dependent hydrolase (beta-lactamase superfamily II)